MLMAKFYGIKMEPDEKCASFGTRLEQKLNQVSLQYQTKFLILCIGIVSEKGFSKNMRTNLRTQFEGGANYYK